MAAFGVRGEPPGARCAESSPAARCTRRLSPWPRHTKRSRSKVRLEAFSEANTVSEDCAKMVPTGSPRDDLHLLRDGARLPRRQAGGLDLLHRESCAGGPACP